MELSQSNQAPVRAWRLRGQGRYAASVRVSDSPAQLPADQPPLAVGRGGFALRCLQTGAVVVVLIATLHRAYELDRFLIPKELVLNLTALLAGVAGLARLRRVKPQPVDFVLIPYLVVSGVSAVLATNVWLGFRAAAVSVAGALLFWLARALAREGRGAAVLNAVALAVTLATATALLQTYGVEPDLFSRNRAPGGTLGNRNFVGHIAAFGLPVLLFASLRARGALAHLIGGLGVAAATATLVLTRSRAAWVAAAAVLGIFVVAFVASRAIRTSRQIWLRSALLVMLTAGAVAAALLVPNALRWRSDNPYLDSVRGVASYDEGSGRGRLIQYERSMRMMLSRPLLGVGPGNWPVEYAEYAARRDPSLDPSEGGMTYNPWPSSDWVAFLSERGLLGGALIAAVLLMIAFRGLRRLRAAADPDEALRSAALVATIVGASVAGLFDAVLLLAAPALLVWSAIGALYPQQPLAPIADAAEPEGNRVGRVLYLTAIAGALLVSAAASVRSGAQVAAMELHSHAGRASLQLAARVDPANYRIHVALARNGSARARCAHATAAHRLFPNAASAAQLARRCD